MHSKFIHAWYLISFMWKLDFSSNIQKYDSFNTKCHELWKREKCSSLVQPRCMFYKTRWAWQEVKLTWLMSIFSSKKVWKFLIKTQLSKSDPKKTFLIVEFVLKMILSGTYWMKANGKAFKKVVSSYNRTITYF